MAKFMTRLTSDGKSPITRSMFRSVKIDVAAWSTGVRVESYTDDTGKEAFKIFATAGMGESFKRDKLIGTVKNGEFNRELTTAGMVKE